MRSVIMPKARMKFHVVRLWLQLECGHCNRLVFDVDAYYIAFKYRRREFLVGDGVKNELCWDCGIPIKIPRIFHSAPAAEVEIITLNLQVVAAPEFQSWFPFVPMLDRTGRKDPASTFVRHREVREVVRIENEVTLWN